MEGTTVQEATVMFQEVKTGNSQPSKNQKAIAAALANGTAIPVGRNAALAGFIVGKPVGEPFIVKTIRY